MPQNEKEHWKKTMSIRVSNVAIENLQHVGGKDRTASKVAADTIEHIFGEGGVVSRLKKNSSKQK
jgi:hypothetical protein